MSQKPGKQMATRIFIIMLTVIIAFSGVSVFRLVNIMMVRGQEFQTKAAEQQLYDSFISAPRGDIYDCNMQVLARSTTAWTVYITPNGIRNLEDEDLKEKVRVTIAENLSAILEVDYDKVYEQTNKNSYYVIVKKKIDKTDADKVRSFLSDENYDDLNLVQYVGLDETTKRYYPNDSLASVVLGFVGSDDQGLAGLESYYDNELTGIPGRVVAAKSADGTDMSLTYERVEEGVKGKSLVLTIDSYIQYTAEKYLEAAIAENEIAERGVAVIMNVKTGAIYGMAVKGDFNPNEPFELSEADKKLIEETTGKKKKETLKNNLINRQWRNKAVSDTYEPGSVFKIITAAIALEENLISPKNTFYCNGSTTVAGQHYNCHKKSGHGTQTLAEAMSHSCNPAFITIGQQIGVKTFSKYFKAFGLTEITGIDLPGEANSRYHKQENMGPVELSSTSFGQTFNITPMQLISAASACVNGGYLVKPHLVSKMIDVNGNTVKTMDTGYKRQVISESTSKIIREQMEFVAENGAKNALVAGYRVGAKTGTSQKVSKIQATGDTYLYIGSCISVAPANDPEIAVLVLLDEPKGDNYYGGVISAPVNGKIMTDILPYLGYEPSYTESELKNLATTVPETVGMTVDAAKSKLSSSKLEYQIQGKGDKIIKQLPESGNQVLNGGIVILYTEETEEKTVRVPDLLGLTATEVNRRAAAAGINIEFSGNTSSSGLRSYRQSIDAGETVEAGTIVTVYFRDSTVVDG